MVRSATAVGDSVVVGGGTDAAGGVVELWVARGVAGTVGDATDDVGATDEVGEDAVDAEGG